MPTEYWRSPETIDRLNRLERPGFAAEFLRRNPDYRRDFVRTQRQIARASVDAETARVSLARRWGCAFAHDPASPVGLEPILWLPEVSPATLILEPAPSGFDTTISFDTGAFSPAPVERTDADGREVVIVDGADELHIRLQDDQARRRPAVLLPLDSMFELRLDVALRFARRLGGQRLNFLPAALRLTSFQKRRLIQLLHAFDVHDAGGGPRDIAAEVLSSDHAQLPSVEWKDSHARRKANRLIHDSIALVERGYLKLLRGL